MGTNSIKVFPARNEMSFVEPIGQDGLADCLKYVQQDPAKTILVLKSTSVGDPIQEIVRLCNSSRLLNLHVKTAGLRNIQQLEFLSSLRSISFDGRVPFDFAPLAELRRVGGVYDPQWRGLDALGNLEDLHISGYRENTLARILLPTLRSLQIISTSIETLDGVARLRSLQCLSITSAPNLKAVSGVNGSTSLESIELELCKHVSDIVCVTGLPHLKWLSITDCGSVDTISFISNLVALQGLGLVGTRVRDGNLAPCLSHPSLKRLGIIDAAKYKPSVKEVLELLKVKERSSHEKRGGGIKGDGGN